jgi:hypothetical protein
MNVDFRAIAASIGAVVLVVVASSVVAMSSAGKTVSTAAELVAALRQGGEIQLQPGTYDGNFQVTVPGTVVRGVSLPGRRVGPDDVSAVKLTPAKGQQPTLTITASNVTVQGIYIANGAPSRECVVIGSPVATSASAQPENVTLDSVAIVAGEGGGHRGIAAHGAGITLIRSHVANFWEIGRDSQAFWANNGPGPYRIEDNYLEGSGENIMFGGASVRIPNLVPADITIRNNDIVKPEEWKTTRRRSVKNSVEFKNARRVLLENNRIDGNWKDAQAGHTIVLTPRNQAGDSPWVIVDDVTIRGNIVTNTPDGFAVNILGTDDRHSSQQVRRVVIEENLFRDAKSGILVNGGVADALIVRHNTFPAIGSSLLAFDGKRADGTPKVVTPLTLENNVFRSGAYGITGRATPVGLPSLEIWATPFSVKGNVIGRSKKRSIKWPSGNTLVDVDTLLGNLDPATFKYRDGDAGY